MKKKFAEAEELLTEQGHVVINPAMLPEGLGSCDTYMGICFAMIDVCDAVVMLDGWREALAPAGSEAMLKGAIRLLQNLQIFKRKKLQEVM